MQVQPYPIVERGLTMKRMMGSTRYPRSVEASADTKSHKILLLVVVCVFALMTSTAMHGHARFNSSESRSERFSGATRRSAARALNLGDVLAITFGHFGREERAIPSEGNWAGFWGNEAIDQRSCTISQHPGRSCFSQTFQSSRLSA
jgi:hypothetical protein